MSNSGEIEVGDIFKIAADEENGITPPGGRDVWYKHFVVIGCVIRPIPVHFPGAIQSPNEA